MAAAPFYRHGDSDLVASLVDGRAGFRIVKSARPHTRHFWSDADAGKPPDREPVVLYLGLSVFLTPELARERAEAYPVIGRWIAQLELAPERGFWFAPTFSEYHITVWGLPDDLVAAVVDVQPV